MVVFAQKPKSVSLLDFLYHSTSFAFHLSAMSMPVDSPLPVDSSWEEGSEGRGQGEFRGREQAKEKGFWRTLGDHNRAGRRWGPCGARQNLQASLRWGDAGPFPAPVQSEEEQQRSGRDGAFSHPSLVS